MRGEGVPPAEGDPDAPAVLVTVYDPVEAEIIVAKLRSAGIEAYARHDALSVVYGLTVDGFGRQDVLVRRVDLGEAKAVLADEEPDDFEAAEDEHEPEGTDDGGTSEVWDEEKDSSGTDEPAVGEDAGRDSGESRQSGDRGA